MTVRLTRDLLAEGYSHNELAALARSGGLARIRRGAYDASVPADPTVEHLRAVEATVRLAAPDAVVSHLSAAVVHGLPVVATRLGRVQLTRSGVTGGKNRGGIHLHAAPLEPDEVVEVSGVRVTSLARTVVDVARSVAFEQAVMAGDVARRRGLSVEEVEACLQRSAGRPGIAKARRAAGFLDPLSESPGESLSRVVLHNLAMPPPRLQHEVRDSAGRLVGRADFAWEEQWTLGEFDGRVKYQQLLKPGQTVSEVVQAEKRREDALRDLGWEVVRWTFAELRTPRVIADRLWRAFARASRKR